MTAADVRKHVMTGSLLLHPSAVAAVDSPDSGPSHPLNLIDIADPLDVEEILSQKKTTSAIYEHTNGSPKRVGEFPADDMEVRLVHREQLTIEPPFSPNLPSIDPIVRDIIRTYNDDFSLVQRKYHQYSSGEAYVRMLMERPLLLQSSQKQVYEVESDRTLTRSFNGVDDQVTKRDSYGSHYSSDSICTGGSSSGGTTRDDTMRQPHHLNSSASDPTVPGVVQRISNTQLDQINEARRQGNRQNVVVSLLPPLLESEIIERRSPPPFPAEHTGQRLYLKILKLQLEPSFEPVFGIIALFDIKQKRKISENFYFDLNEEPLLKMLSNHIKAVDAASKCTQAAFSISGSLKDIFIVIRLEKVLQACEISEACEPYLKEERNRERLIQNAKQYCERLGEYRMPLGWMAIDVNRILTGALSLEKAEMINANTVSSSCHPNQGEAVPPVSPGPQYDTESIISADRISCSTSGTFRRIGSGTSAQSVLTVVQKLNTPQQKRKFFSTISQTLSSQLEAVTNVASSAEITEEQKKSSVSSLQVSLSNLQPLIVDANSFFRQETDHLTDEDLCKMLLEIRKNGSKLSRLKSFPAVFRMEISGIVTDDTQTKLTPELLHMQSYAAEDNIGGIEKEIAEFPCKGNYAVNACYRNLLYVYPRFVNFSNRSGTARNICVRVELMDGQERPLHLVFGKSSCPDIGSYANTSISYHNKSPSFYDEIKICIPVDLNDDHHLLFTFYHISCKQKVNDEIDSPIGYSCLRLFKDGRLQTGDITLPICLERFSTKNYWYLPPEVHLPNVKWLDGHKPLFSVSLRALTTVHTQDTHLDTFLHAFQTLSGPLKKKMEPISEADLKSAIRGVIKARPEPMVAFLYAIIDRLLALIVSPPYSVSVSGVCFEVLGQLVKICTVLLNTFCDAHGRSSLLTTYVHYNKIALKECTLISQRDSSSLSEKSERSVQSPGSPETHRLHDIIRDFERSGFAKSTEDDKTVNKKLMHEELVLQWVMSSGTSRETAFLNSWFFLELIVKSMAEYLSLSNRLYLPRKMRFSSLYIQNLNALSQAIISEILQRAQKDERQAHSINSSWGFFIKDVFSLMDRTYVMNLLKQYNREICAKIVSSSESQAVTLMLLKLDLVHIVCSHEHYIALNLPVSFPFHSISTSHSIGSFHSVSSGICKSSDGASDGTFNNVMSASVHGSSPQLQAQSPTNSSVSSRTSSQINETHGCAGSAELTYEYRSRHYLTALALSDLSSVAVGLIRNLLTCHECDARFMDQSCKARVALLYLPLIGIVLDVSSQLFNPYMKGGPVRNSGLFGTSSASESFGMLHELDDCSCVNKKIMLAIGGLSSSPPVSPPPQANPAPRKPTLSLEITRQLLACLCWTLKNIDRSAFRQWVRELSSSRLSQFLYVLQLTVSCFEYKYGMPANHCVGFCGNKDVGPEALESDVRKKFDDSVSGDSTVSKEVLRKVSRGFSDNEAVKWRKEPLFKHSFKSNTCSSCEHSAEEVNYSDVEQSLEASLCTEVPLIVLDTMEYILRVVVVSGGDQLFFVLPLILKVLMHMLACSQSVQSLENIFASQRAIVIKFPDLLFQQETEQCGELCLHLLRHCASRLPSVRSQAAASLYLLMRQSFESGANLSKVKMQITMSLSTLVSLGTRQGNWINEDCLRRSLKTVLTYSETDAFTDSQLRSTTFAEQVKDLVFNLHMILSDTVKMKEYTNDFEMLIDLMYRVAKGYQNNPDLRLTWLINMANKHAARNNAAEAAECMLHAAALAAEYISMREFDTYLPKGAVAFADISDNILEESAVSDDVVSPNEEGICESRHFTPTGLVQLVEKTAQFLEKAQMFELIPQVYKIITPILEQTRDYRHLAQVYNHISEALVRVEPLVPLVEDISDAWFSPLPGADKRCFGTYFRVGFYGNRFGDLDGVEFIYKEPAITKLSEISHRLEGFYADRFGEGTVEVIKDSNVVLVLLKLQSFFELFEVDRGRLNSSKAYLQITYVEPYLEKWERRRRQTHFERNHNLCRFVYATPFTKDGRPHGDLKDQYKRRTILTTQCCFPYVKTRLQVINRESSVLTPIEVAIEDVQKKTRELAAATAQNPPDAKILQMVLQGCIGTTVNQGPIEVANVFLTNIALTEHGKPADKFQNKLRLCFKDFSKKCADALQKNKLLIQADQQAYQNELQKNYIEFTKKMAPIVGGNSGRKTSNTEANSLKTAQVAVLSREVGPVTAV
uniref:Dedicator of cytokinesis protein 6 n=1 Tax=Syphacia muris TaxID=451379 RepID=A0A0N5ALW0_9BILA